MENSTANGDKQGEQRTNTDDTLSEELRETIAEAARELEAVGEPVTIGRLAGTVHRFGVDEYQFETVADAGREYLDERDELDVTTEVAR